MRSSARWHARRTTARVSSESPHGRRFRACAASRRTAWRAASRRRLRAEDVTERTASQLRDYARLYLEGAFLGMVDAEGRPRAPRPRIGGRSEQWVSPPTPAGSGRHRRSTPSRTSTSGCSRSCMADRLPRELLTAPRPDHPERQSPRQPQRGCRGAKRVPVCRPYETRGMTARQRRAARHRARLRREELLHRWQAAFATPAQEIRAKWLLPS